ncbi:hypothetical protein Clacol_009738 [Clathrus columnatus]|uniref:Uncharacterized protein n=1 Tax=Clathrus columnatus TaxID=1419009 RepID=A0AAV5AU95_9AGAM|nr:hypothetical protein Clacol_009738 [Clathrus columnatus]
MLIEMDELLFNSAPSCLANATSYRPLELWVPDYSTFHVGCASCGKIISQVRDTIPTPCLKCASLQYCVSLASFYLVETMIPTILQSFSCLAVHSHILHRPDCVRNIIRATDISGMDILDRMHAKKDLELFCFRWREALGDAAISALDLRKDITILDRQALVIHLNYVRHQPYRVQRFSYSHSVVQDISDLRGGTLNEAILQREKHSVINQNRGMLGCILIVLACNVPGLADPNLNLERFGKVPTRERFGLHSAKNIIINRE